MAALVYIPPIMFFESFKIFHLVLLGFFRIRCFQFFIFYLRYSFLCPPKPFVKIFTMFFLFGLLNSSFLIFLFEFKWKSQSLRKCVHPYLVWISSFEECASVLLYLFQIGFQKFSQSFHLNWGIFMFFRGVITSSFFLFMPAVFFVPFLWALVIFLLWWLLYLNSASLT